MERELERPERLHPRGPTGKPEPAVTAKPRVLMVLPNQRWCGDAQWTIHPYGLCVMLALLKGWCETAFLDAHVDDLDPETFARRVAAFDPDVVGVSVLSDSYRRAGFQACELIKQAAPRATTVMGGVFVTTRPAKAMAHPAVDYGVMGEGEYVFPQLVRHIMGQEPNPPEEGVVFRAADGELVIRPQKTFIEDLDRLPFPDYSVLDFTKYSTEFYHETSAPRAVPYGKMVTSRGCPIGCVFCEVEHIAGRRVRAMSPERVIAEIEQLIADHGIRSIEFLDDQLIGNVHRFRRLLELLIAKDWDLVWNAHNVSVFLLDEALLDLMKAAKCVFTSLAVESGSPRVLKEIIGKPVNIDHAVRLAEHARAIGIDTCGLFVIGFPGETWDEIRATIRLAETLPVDYVKINIAAPFPGTRLYDLAIRTGALPPDFDMDTVAWGKSVMATDQFTPDQLRILRAFEWERINFATPEKRAKLARMMGLTLQEVDAIRRKTIDLKLE